MISSASEADRWPVHGMSEIPTAHRSHDADSDRVIICAHQRIAVESCFEEDPNEPSEDACKGRRIFCQKRGGDLRPRFPISCADRGVHSKWVVLSTRRCRTWIDALVACAILSVFLLPLALGQDASPRAASNRGRAGNFFRRLLSSATGCDAGAYYDSASHNCTGCPAFSWSPAGSDGIQNCSCNAGYVGDGTTNCTACANNTFKNVSGPGNCTQCPDYSFSPAGSTSANNCTCQLGYQLESNLCVPCAVGTFRGEGMTECMHCASGTFAAMEGALECVKCAANSTSPNGSAGCICNAGYYGPPGSGGSCMACEPDTYNPLSNQTTDSACIPCPHHSMAAEASADAADCMCCAGYYGQPWTGSNCSACPSNTYNPLTNLTDISSCHACPSSSTSPEGSTMSSQCICNAGYYGGFQSASCVACPVDTYNPDSNQTMVAGCLACTDFSSAPEGSTSKASCTCNAGYFGSPGSGGQCTACVSGTYNQLTNQTSNNSCIQCPSNSSSDEASPGKSGCTCLAGFFAMHTSGCWPCPVGTYNPLVNGTSDAACLVCPSGSSSPSASIKQSQCVCNPGYFGAPGNCSICPANTYNPKTNQTTEASCISCTSFSSAPEGSTTMESCICNAGHWGWPASNNGTCVACAENTFNPWRNQTNSSACRSCPSHSIAPSGSVKISDCQCDRGYFGRPLFDDMDDRSSMQDGNFTETPAPYTNTSYEPCVACPSGTFKTEVGPMNCSNCAQSAISPVASVAIGNCSCQVGFYGDGVSNCTACPEYTYFQLRPGFQRGYSDCRMCPPNAWSPPGSQSKTNCTCEQGFTGPDGGVCTACRNETYKAVNGSSDCVDCPAFSFSPNASVSVFDCECLPGYTGSGQGNCSACPENFYKPSRGFDNCSECPALSGSLEGSTSVAKCSCFRGYTSPSLGADCEKCAENTYKDDIGTHACTPCPENSVSHKGSTRRTDCKCLPGYGGDNLTCTRCPVGTIKENNGSAPCTPCVTCPVGHYSLCTKLFNGTCEACTNKPDNSYYVSGIQSVLIDEWETGVPCQRVGRIVHFLSSTCYVPLHRPHSCPWKCNAGWYRLDGQCVPCSTEPCRVGEYRGACSDSADGVCMNCTNAIPPNASYSSPGVPANANNCSWLCNAGFYQAQANLSNVGFECHPCTNAIPDNAVYSQPSDTLGFPVCPWACAAGYYADGMICTSLPASDACTDWASCPFPRVVDAVNGSVRLQNLCYEWEYVTCSDGVLSCGSCEGLVRRQQGGWALRTFTPCPIGQYRAPCDNRCIFPNGGNVKGQCINCTNAKTLHAVYKSSGDPHDANNCMWECEEGYNKTLLSGRDQCIRF